ncbi:hypothetical protein MM213_03725 [Belliella sp. R4-6]|uniref:RND transporter n=1 Tax=Belliella alkalica TaxID=1730871 RepID=A0ABS9V9G8_9BACT|nr:hypothetical protein [Belliella alkalica]MCH7412583.1 hypothetical protein [Belliella alkalica]
MKTSLNSWKFVAILCLTLGLAPFFPEPHIFGKVRWILGGANGMEALDWIDFFFHGLPFFLLFRLIINRFRKFAAKKYDANLGK